MMISPSTSTPKKIEKRGVSHFLPYIHTAGRKLENYIRAYVSHLPNALRRHFFYPRATNAHHFDRQRASLRHALRGRREGLKNYTPFFPRFPPTVNGAGRNIAFGEERRGPIFLPPSSRLCLSLYRRLWERERKREEATCCVFFAVRICQKR